MNSNLSKATSHGTLLILRTMAIYLGLIGLTIWIDLIKSKNI